MINFREKYQYSLFFHPRLSKIFYIHRVHEDACEVRSMCGLIKTIPNAEIENIPEKFFLFPGIENQRSYYKTQKGSLFYFDSFLFNKRICVCIKDDLGIHQEHYWDEKKTQEYFKRMKKTRIRKATSLSSRIKEARKLLKENSPPAAVASYAVIKENNTEYYASDICHARMGNKGVDILAVVDIHNKWKDFIEKKKQTTYKQAVKYVLSESPWKDAFLSKNHVNFLNHGVVIDVDNKNSYVAQAVMALRMPKERQKRLPIFRGLKKAGVSSDIAYLLMMCFEESRNGYSLSIPSGHSPISPLYILGTYFSFLKGNMRMFQGEKDFRNAGMWQIFYKFETARKKDEGVYRKTLRNVVEEFLELPENKGKKKIVKAGWGNPYVYYHQSVIVALGKELDRLLTEFEK